MKTRRSGWTGQEMLICLAILGIIIALVVTGIQSRAASSSVQIPVGKGVEASGTVTVDVEPVTGSFSSDSATDVRDAVVRWQKAHLAYRLRTVTSVFNGSDHPAIKALVIVGYVEADGLPPGPK